MRYRPRRRSWRPAPWRYAFLVLAALAAGPLVGHTDLHLQIQALGAAIANRPNEPELYLKRANLHRRHGDWNRARGDLQRARWLGADDHAVDLLDARILAESGQYAKALELLEQFIAVQDRHATAQLLRASTLEQLERFSDAADAYAKAIQYSSNPPAELFQRYIMAIMRGGLDRWTLADMQAQRALERFPRVTSLRALAIDIALGRGDALAAHALLSVIPQRLQSLPRWLWLRGQIGCLRRDAQRARADFRQALGRLQGDLRLARADEQALQSRLQAAIRNPSPEQCRKLIVRQNGIKY